MRISNITVKRLYALQINKKWNKIKAEIKITNDTKIMHVWKFLKTSSKKSFDAFDWFLLTVSIMLDIM